MNKREMILKAAEAIEGNAILLPDNFDHALIGYTIPKGIKTVLGVYDATEMIGGDLDREDAVIEEMKAINGDLKPVLVHRF